MKIFQNSLLHVSLFACTIGAAAAQDANSAAGAAAKSATDAASSAKSAAASKEETQKLAEAAAAKLELPVAIAIGDRIKLRSTIRGLALVGDAPQNQFAAPPDTCLRVTRLHSDSGITVAVEAGDLVPPRSCQDPTRLTPPSGYAAATVGDSYKISGDQLKSASYARYGWIYGPMLVPFKFFPHDRSFEPSQSLGMYMGYRTSWFESRGLSWVASAGLATMKVAQVVDDPKEQGKKVVKESTVAGYTVAGGMLFDLTREAKPFVAGLLVGRDFVGRNSALTYVHDNKTWIALQIGWTL